MSDTTDPGCFPATPGASRGIYLERPTLPLGRWHVMANNRIHNLDITSVSGEVVSGEYNGERIFWGQGNAGTHMLKFYRFTKGVLAK